MALDGVRERMVQGNVQDPDGRRVSTSRDDAGGSELKFARINADADGSNTVVTAVAGKKIRVKSYVLTADVAGQIDFRSSGGAVLAEFEFAGATGGGAAYGGPVPAFETVAGEGLVVFTSAGLDGNGHLSYVEM